METDLVESFGIILSPWNILQHAMVNRKFKQRIISLQGDFGEVFQRTGKSNDVLLFDELVLDFVAFVHGCEQLPDEYFVKNDVSAVDQLADLIIYLYFVAKVIQNSHSVGFKVHEIVRAFNKTVVIDQ